jgi:hypothetical protein
MYLLCNSFTFVKAYVKISKNKGATTLGHKDEKIMDLFGKSKDKTIAKEIKERGVEFSPMKRIWASKPGKKKK